MLTDTIYGPMEVFPPPDLISDVLVSHGEWAYAEVQSARAGLRPTDTLFDGGAFIGTFSLGVGAAVQKIVAIEPNAPSYSLLETNLRRNCPVAFSLAQVVLGSQGGGAARQVCSDETSANHGAQKFEPLAPETFRGGDAARVVTLGELRMVEGDYSALKLDIEGAEFAALLGDAKYIRDVKPLLWLECNERPGVRLLLEFMVWAGYAPYYIAFPAFRQTTAKGTPAPPFPIACEGALIGAAGDRLVDILSTAASHGASCRPIGTYEDLRQALWETPRWGRADWVSKSNHELIALLGRASLSQTYETFLV